MKIETENLTIENKPEIVFTKFITLVKNNEEIGTIDATFDFSELPEKYHELVVAVIQRRGSRVHLAIK